MIGISWMTEGRKIRRTGLKGRDVKSAVYERPEY
jgi:hypothetical protein